MLGSANTPEENDFTWLLRWARSYPSVSSLNDRSRVRIEPYGDQSDAGWMLHVLLAGTPLANAALEPVDESVDETRWSYAAKQDDRYVSTGDPGSLQHLVHEFRKWVDSLQD